MPAYVWRFEQLGGDKTVLTLEGYAAPFGRPRKHPVVVEKITQKIQTVRYPGRNGNPTRHILGTEWGDLELEGRWMDKFLTTTSDNMILDWTNFIQDGQRIRISWGNIVSYIGIVESGEFARESATEVAWKLKILVDDRDGINVVAFPNKPTDIRDNVAEVKKSTDNFLALAKKITPTVKDWKPDVFDLIGNIVSSVNSFTSSFLKIANQFDDIRAALTSELFRLQSSIRSLRTATMAFESMLQTMDSDVVLFTRFAEADLNWASDKINLLLATQEMLAFLAFIDIKIDIQNHGNVITTYVAREEDTWDGIAALAYNDPTRANDIRQANNIRFGELPTPGRTYQIPQ